jgi:transcription elongation GreA/GreB family factor
MDSGYGTLGTVMGGKADKHALLEALKDELTSEITRSTRRALEAAEAATHEENRSEGDKDMRSTEASYVARGQAERVHELEKSLAKLGAMAVKEFGKGAGIEASAIVEIEHDGGGGGGGGAKKKTTYFVVPAGGGIRIRASGVEVLTLATTSPLGAAILGLTEGDEAEVEGAQGTKSYTVLAVR